MNVISDIFYIFEKVDPETVGNQEVAFDGSTRGEGINDLKVYDISLLSPAENYLLNKVLFGDTEEEESTEEEDNESSYLIEEAVIQESVNVDESGLSQRDLDNRLSLSDQLFEEFDCLKI